MHHYRPCRRRRRRHETRRWWRRSRMVDDMRMMRWRPVLRMVRGPGSVVVRMSPGILVDCRFLRRAVAVSAAWRGEGRSAECHACKACNHEFLEVPVVHNAPLYTFFFVVMQEPISRLRQGRGTCLNFLTRIKVQFRDDKISGDRPRDRLVFQGFYEGCPQKFGRSALRAAPSGTRQTLPLRLCR